MNQRTHFLSTGSLSHFFKTRVQIENLDPQGFVRINTKLYAMAENAMGEELSGRTINLTANNNNLFEKFYRFHGFQSDVQHYHEFISNSDLDRTERFDFENFIVIFQYESAFESGSVPDMENVLNKFLEFSERIDGFYDSVGTIDMQLALLED